MMEWIIYLSLIGSVWLGAAISFFLGDKIDNKLMLSLSGAYLLGISVLHLLPEVYEVENVGPFVLGGFIIQLLLESLSRGVEHGHIHVHAVGKKEKYFVGFSVLLGLSLHAFMEGIPLGGSTNQNELLYAILLHKVPASIALICLLKLADFKGIKLIGLILAFSLMSPLGAFLPKVSSFFEIYYPQILAIVTGSFLHISTTILFESEEGRHHKIPLRKLIAVAIGLGLSLLSIL